MRVILLLLLFYHTQTINNHAINPGVVDLSSQIETSPSPQHLKISKLNPSKQDELKSTSPIKIINITLANNIPVIIPSPLNDPNYYAIQSAFTVYHALFLQKQTCAAKNTIVTNVAIRQHNTSYYLTSQKYYLSFKKGNPTKSQLFTAIQSKDCSWSFMSKEGLYVSLKTQYNYLMLEPSISPTQKFKHKQKNDYLYIQSAENTPNYWTVINGIGRLGSKQGSRFVIQKWAQLQK